MWASEWAGPAYLLFWLPCMERQLIAGIGGGRGGEKEGVEVWICRTDRRRGGVQGC